MNEGWDSLGLCYNLPSKSTNASDTEFDFGNIYSYFVDIKACYVDIEACYVDTWAYYVDTVVWYVDTGVWYVDTGIYYDVAYCFDTDSHFVETVDDTGFCSVNHFVCDSIYTSP